MLSFVVNIVPKYGGKPSRRWEDNTKWIIKEYGVKVCSGFIRLRMTNERGNGPSGSIKLWGGGNFLTSWATTSFFSRITLLHQVIYLVCAFFSVCFWQTRNILVCHHIIMFLAGAGNFSLLHRVQNGSWAHPASYPMGTGGSFPGSKAAGAWSWPLTSI
jgi:hypothetical protein